MSDAVPVVKSPAGADKDATSRRESIAALPRVGEGWFSELSEEMWPGQALSLEVDEVLFSGRSKYQDVVVFKSKTWGKALALDGVMQFTERDECAYQEMMAHVPLFSHPDPKKVLVVGGGDGGVLREIARHQCVEEIHICELDEVVIETTRKFVPQLGCGFDDPRVQIHIQDGSEFIKKSCNMFDVIICDLSDPVGPAQDLYEKPFYQSICRALTENGVAAAQGECFWLHKDVISKLVRNAREVFNAVGYATMSIPTYPCGQIGVLHCTKSSLVPVGSLAREVPIGFQKQLKYWTPDVHRSSFHLPAFVRRELFGEDI
jgi:spermidine synthase